MDCVDYRDSGELSDIRILVDDKEFNLHKFPLFVRSNYFKNTATKTALAEHSDKLTIRLDNFPGGAKTFALIADYCYNKEIHVDSVNVIDVKCAAEFLEMSSNGKGGLCMFVDNILFDILYVAKSKRNFKLILQLIEESVKQKEVVEKCKLNLRLLDAFIDYISLTIKLNSAYNSLRHADLLGKDELRVITHLPLSWFVYLIKSKVHISSYTNLLSSLVELYIDYNTNLNPNFNAQSQIMQPLLQPLQIDVQTTSAPAAAATGVNSDTITKTSSPAISPILNSNSNELFSSSGKNDELHATSSQFMDTAVSTVLAAVRAKNFSDNEKVEIIREVAVAFNEVYYENQLSLTWLLTYLNVLNTMNADTSLKSIFLKWIWNAFNNLKQTSDELNTLPVDVMQLLVQDISAREDTTGYNLERIINLTDHYLSDLEKNKKLTPDVFVRIAQSIPKEKRSSCDNLMSVLLEMLKKDCFSISSAKQQELLDLIDFHKLNETTLESCKNSESIPPKYVTEAALALCAKLRQELDEHKALVKSLETKVYPSLSTSRVTAAATTTTSASQLLADLNLYRPTKVSATSLAATPSLLTKYNKTAYYQKSPLKSASSSNLYKNTIPATTTTTMSHRTVTSKKATTPTLTRRTAAATTSLTKTSSTDRLFIPSVETQIVISSEDDDIDDVSSLEDNNNNNNSLCNYHRSRFYDELLHSKDYYYTPTTTTTTRVSSSYRPTSYSTFYYDSLRF